MWIAIVPDGKKSMTSDDVKRLEACLVAVKEELAGQLVAQRVVTSLMLTRLAARAEDPYLELDDMLARLRGTLHDTLQDPAAPETSISHREAAVRALKQICDDAARIFHAKFGRSRD
jgi:hypothetical protein